MTTYLYHKLNIFFKPRNHIHFWIFLVCTKPWHVQNEKEILWYSMNIKFIMLYYIIYCIYIIILVFINCTGKNNMINSVQYKIVIIKYSLINIYLCIYKYIHIYYIENKWTFIHMYLWMYIRVYVHTYIHSYIFSIIVRNFEYERKLVRT